MLQERPNANNLSVTHDIRVMWSHFQHLQNRMQVGRLNRLEEPVRHVRKEWNLMMPYVIASRQVRTEPWLSFLRWPWLLLHRHGCYVSLAPNSGCSIFLATRRCKGSSCRLHFRGGLVCTHIHTNTNIHAQHGIDCSTAIPLYRYTASAYTCVPFLQQDPRTRLARSYSYFFPKFVTNHSPQYLVML